MTLFFITKQHYKEISKHCVTVLSLSSAVNSFHKFACTSNCNFHLRTPPRTVVKPSLHYIQMLVICPFLLQYYHTQRAKSLNHLFTLFSEAMTLTF